MPVIHVVSFKYKDSVSAKEQGELWDDLNALRTECLYTDGKPYIHDFKGSTENISPEGAGKGFDVLFVSTFPSREHVKYYLEKDPVHLAFVVSHSGVRTKRKAMRHCIADILVADFDRYRTRSSPHWLMLSSTTSRSEPSSQRIRE